MNASDYWDSFRGTLDGEVEPCWQTTTEITRRVRQKAPRSEPGQVRRQLHRLADAGVYEKRWNGNDRVWRRKPPEGGGS